MEPHQSVGRLFILLGVIIVVIGAILYLAPRFPLLDRLPGNLRWQKGPITVYFPLGVCLAVSMVLTIIFHILGRK
jgi:hypothetical protein